MKLKIKYIVTFLFISAAALGFLILPTVRNPTTNGFISSAQNVSGKDLFKSNCARCHGADGSGKAPDLTDERRQAKWKDSDERIVKKITNGALGMPAFGKKLKPEQINAVAAYVRTLKK